MQLIDILILQNETKAHGEFQEESKRLKAEGEVSVENSQKVITKFNKVNIFSRNAI